MVGIFTREENNYTIQLFKNNDAICEAVVLDAGTIVVNFV